MRALLLSTPYTTHFMPLVPMAWALRTLGCEVLVAGQPEVTETARSAGLCTTTIGERFHGFDELHYRLASGERPLQLMGRQPPELTQAGTTQWAVHARYHLASYLELAEEFAPDLVVSERMEAAGPIIARKLGVLAVAHRWGIDPMGATAREVAALQLTGACERLGIGGFPEPDLLLDPCPPELQVRSDEVIRPVRYVPFNGTGERPRWRFRSSPSVGGRNHRVCVTLGRQTLALNGLPLLRSIIDAASRLRDVEFVVTAEERYYEEIGAVPDNVMLIEPTPLDLFLGECDAVVHHGGSGTVLSCVHHGLPQLVLPQIADQFSAAKTLREAGAAKALFRASEQDDSAVLGESIRELLDQPEHGARARELRRSMHAMPSPAEVARQLRETVVGPDAGEFPTSGIENSARVEK
ncbi:UDP:flavonoid glycosyltransferase YjiC (YdhE family) [Saccharopolyspora lacisalsi]|uniref:UDP:flavonoid glycosyltransferase YjiC (YdhE family) n=1 Tax=Halosaccharopolyspora lacisalsi TaxID=1000566 RepID=A0A839E724_9PSEU|nr:glycosyltransferase [Halosaccharopolyspora lacisalsi]MBA8827497.1 UDP:flavonoid glycosyltransferase YjiC (YdhE family) [Halosaccharopolyspora lacisalsi]